MIYMTAQAVVDFGAELGAPQAGSQIRNPFHNTNGGARRRRDLSNQLAVKGAKKKTRVDGSRATSEAGAGVYDVAFQEHE